MVIDSESLLYLYIFIYYFNKILRSFIMSIVPFKKNLLWVSVLSVGLLFGGCSYHKVVDFEGKQVVISNPTTVTHNGETYDVATSVTTMYKKEVDAILNAKHLSRQNKQGALYVLAHANAQQREEILDTVLMQEFKHDGHTYSTLRVYYKENQPLIQKILASKSLSTAQKQDWLSKLGKMSSNEEMELAKILTAN